MKSKETVYYSHTRQGVLNLIPRDASRLLDVGCATGAMGAEAMRRGVSEVYGIEVHEPSAAAARKVLTAVLTMDVETGAIPWKDLDCIVCADVLEHLKDPWAALEKLRPCLREDGILIACIPNLAHLKVLIKILTDRFQYEEEGILDKTHLRFFTKQTVERLFSTTGYRIESIKPVRPGGWKWLLLQIASLGVLRRYVTYQYLVIARAVN